MEVSEDPESVPILKSEKDENHEAGESDEKEEEGVQEEGWWGWMVVLASFLCNMVIDGMGYSFGVLLEPMKEEFKTGAGSVSFVGSILAGVIMLTAPIAAAAINRFGTRITCIVGSFISAAAMLSSSYSTNLTTLLISYGIFGGFGLGLMYVPAVVAVGQYFNKRLNLATGISVCGSGAGTFIFAPLASSLVQQYGWRGCNRVMAVFCLLCSVCGLVLAPVKTKNTVRQNTKLIDLEIFKNIPFVLVMIGNIPTVMAVYTTYAYLPSMAESFGYTSDKASFLVSMVGITNTVGRVASGWITDIPCISPLVVTITATLLGGIFPVLMPIGGSYSALLVICGLFGFTISALPTTTTGLIVDLLGIRHLNSAFGTLTFVRGTAALLGPPTAGFILDHFSDYSVPFSFSSALLGMSLIIHSIVWCIVRHLRKRRERYEAL
eukprot:GFUD01023481.1.p1 GENE.GFUD01023481.1~~GFUD01023481.1.p1  ORF type:complete len:462 (+),score=95.14 GFUD01023481.1:81-1388(+)